MSLIDISRDTQESLRKALQQKRLFAALHVLSMPLTPEDGRLLEYLRTDAGIRAVAPEIISALKLLPELLRTTHPHGRVSPEEFERRKSVALALQDQIHKRLLSSKRSAIKPQAPRDR